MRRGIVRLAAVWLLVAACGDSEPGDTSSTTTSISTTTTTTTTAAAQTSKCDQVVFTPNSEDGASDVTATGLSCDEAEAFVRIAGQHTSSGGPPELTVEGYRCVVTDRNEDPLPRAFYECEDGDKKVTFVRS